jgi:hypothetical protein
MIKMIKIGFFLPVEIDWIGGLNYLSNLLYAIRYIPDRKIESVIFTGTKTSFEVQKQFSEYGKIIQSLYFDNLNGNKKKLFNSYINITGFLFNREYLFRLAEKNNISVFSHTHIKDKCKRIKTIDWIQDFQHIHYKEFFSKEELQSRNFNFMQRIIDSDRIILSSNNTYEDFKKFAPEYISKVRILRFTVNIFEDIYKKNQKLIFKKYNIPKKYFFLPNQFWQHKNHITVFKAMKILLNRHSDTILLCSGNTSDNRNVKYYGYLRKYIHTNNLGNNIKILGVIKYDDLLVLMRNSVSVINPSLFEG